MERIGRSYLPLIMGGLCAVFLIVGTFYVLGYRFGKNFSVVKAGSISIEVPFAGSNIYLNALKKRSTSKDGETVSFSGLYPGRYTTIVSKDGFYPWTKEASVEENRIVRLRPFLIRSSVSGVVITAEDPAYDKLQSLIYENTLPLASDKKISRDGLVVLWFEDGTIYAEWQGEEKTIPALFCSSSSCSKRIEVLTPTVPLRNLDFYGSRNDVIVLALGESVAAMELDRNGTQNFEPLFKGNSPRMAKTGEGAIIVRDNGVLMQLSL